MAAHEHAPLRVAVLADSEPRREAVGVLLERQGFVVVARIAPGELHAPAQLASQGVDLLLIDLNDDDSAQPDALLGLIEGCPVPVLINDASASAGQADLGPRLARKFRALSGERPRRLRRGDTDAAARPVAEREPVLEFEPPPADPEPASPEDASPGLELEPLPEVSESLPQDPEPAPPEDASPESGAGAVPAEAPVRGTDEARTHAAAHSGSERVRRVWVLGASLGGPQAVRAFLARLPGNLPTAFILAQHIGEGFDRLLASQLNRETALSVSCARAGMQLRDGEVMLAPLDQSLRLDRDGRVSLQPRVEAGIYSPSIDDVMSEVARCYGASAGAIIFSGMGDDGIEGARAIAAEGGVVWAQDEASAVISSMPDHARRAGIVSLSGPPGNLADQLVKTLAASDTLAAL